MTWAIILAGGVGRRFWPLSTAERPKQLLPLVGDQPLLLQAVERLRGLVPLERLLFVTGPAVGAALRRLLPGVPAANVLLEPRGASTAPALAWATAEIARRDPDAAILSLHADWAVTGDTEFRATAARALEAAERHDMLVTVGVPPVRPDPGYGYVVPGDALDGAVRRARRFVEKPDPRAAASLIAEGALWNSGLFAWTARRFTVECQSHAIELKGGAPALARGDVPGFFAAVQPAAVDHALLERSSRVAVVQANFGWDDVGTWAALRRVNPTDAHGNIVRGRIALVDARNCVAWNEEASAPVVLAGVSDLVVVVANGVTLVASAEAALSLKAVLEQLPPELAEGR